MRLEGRRRGWRVADAAGDPAGGWSADDEAGGPPMRLEGRRCGRRPHYDGMRRWHSALKASQRQAGLRPRRWRRLELDTLWEWSAELARSLVRTHLCPGSMPPPLWAAVSLTPCRMKPPTSPPKAGGVGSLAAQRACGEWRGATTRRVGVLPNAQLGSCLPAKKK